MSSCGLVWGRLYRVGRTGYEVRTFFRPFYRTVKALCSATLIMAVFLGARVQLVLLKTTVAVQICSATKPAPVSGCRGDSGFRRATFQSCIVHCLKREFMIDDVRRSLEPPRFRALALKDAFNSLLAFAWKHVCFTSSSLHT